MDGKSSSAYNKLMEGKRRLARARNNPDTLDRALEYIDAALLEHLRSVFPSADIGPYHLFVHLQKDHIIDARERALISSMHSLRNNTAHANPRYLTQNNVERYAVLAKTIMDKTASHKRMGARRTQRNPNELSVHRHRPSSDRPSPLPPVRHQPVASLPITEPRPADIPQPASPQHSLSHHNDGDPSELLEVELGGSQPDPLDTWDTLPVPDVSPKRHVDDNDLLQQLLSTP